MILANVLVFDRVVSTQSYSVGYPGLILTARHDYNHLYLYIPFHNCLTTIYIINSLWHGTIYRLTSEVFRNSSAGDFIRDTKHSSQITQKPKYICAD